MLKYMDEGKQTLEREIDKILKVGDISMSTLEKLGKLMTPYKDLCKIAMMSEEEEQGGSSYEGGSSYRRGGGKNAKRDSMGRYSSEGGSYEGGSPYRGGSSYEGGYSQAKDDMMSMLGEMMEDASPKEREALKKCMRELERD